MGKLWHYNRDGRDCGPVTAADLKLLADAQRLLPMDLVRKEGSSRWVPARSVRGLFAGEEPSLAGRFVSWWGPTGLLVTFAAVLIATVGIVILVFALHNPAAPTAPAAPTPVALAPPPAPTPVAAPANPTPAVPVPAPPGPNEAKAELHHYRHLLGALHEMREARTELKGEGRDHSPHLDEALRALDGAIAQTERALRAAGLDVDAAAADAEDYKKYSDHPHIRHALNEILEAKVEFKDVKEELGGEREKTIRELTFAAEQLESALSFAK